MFKGRSEEKGEKVWMLPFEHCHCKGRKKWTALVLLIAEEPGKSFQGRDSEPHDLNVFAFCPKNSISKYLLLKKSSFVHFSLVLEYSSLYLLFIW